MGKQWRDGKGGYSQPQSPVQYWQGAWKNRQWKQHGTAPWKAGQEDQSWLWTSSSASGTAPPSFPRYDSKDPQLVVVAERKAEEPGIVQTMQRAVTNARKAEMKRRKLQSDLEAKRRCWTGFQQELKATYLKEQQRFQTDVLKLQDEIREAKLQEDAAKQHLVPHGDSGMEEIFPGMDCDGEAAALDATGLMGPGGESQQLGVTGSSTGRGGTFSMHQASMGDNTRSPGMMEDLELRSLLQATSGTLGGHQDTPVPSGIGRGLPPQHAAQRIQVPAMPVLVSQLSTPVRKEGSAAAQNLGLDKVASQDPYQFVGGMTPSAPVISGQGRHHAATASVEESISGPPWYPSTSPTLKKSPNTRESVGRRPIKQVTKKPATRTSPNGPSLADKLEKLRECSGQVGVQIPSGNVPPLAVGPTAPETSQALRELAPAALPQQFVIYDDEDSAGDISDADPEFLAWAASMAGDSKLPEMD